MKVFVTGINGFAGQHLVRELEYRGHDVSGIDIASTSEKVKKADILFPAQIEQALSLVNPDYIIHLAAIASVDHSNASHIYNINFHGTINLLSACAGLDKKPGFLFVSSSQVYGNVAADKLPIDESFQLEPVNHYGASKAAAEMAVRAFGAEYGIPWVIVRPFNHTGPGQSDRFVVPKIVNAFRRRDNSIELGNIHTVRDFTDVRDIARAYADIIENFQHGELYNICSGRGLSVSEIFDMLINITGHGMKIVKKESLVRGNEIQSVTGNAGKLAGVSAWKPRIVIEQTLRDMLETEQ